MTMGSMTGTARDVIDEMREAGKPVGLIKLRGFRPFPREELRKIAPKYKALGMVDRNNCYGSAGGGIVSMEIARALYDLDDRPHLLNFHAGLGGTDVTMEQIEYMTLKTLKSAQTGKVDEVLDWVELHDLEVD